MPEPADQQIQPINAQSYLDALSPVLAAVTRQADGPVLAAADLIADSVRQGGVLQTFGSGHSEALAMELAGRAGSLVPSNRISLRDVVVHGGESPDGLVDHRGTAGAARHRRRREATPRRGRDPAGLPLGQRAGR